MTLTRLCLLFLLLNQTYGQEKKCTSTPGNYRFRCDEGPVSVGSEVQCICLHICRPFSLKCLEDGTFETMAFHMFCNAGYTMDIEVSGRKLNVTFEGLDFIEQCQEGIVRVNWANLCNNGRLNKNLFPLCDNSCHTPPEDLECMRDFLPKTHNMLCRCKENCLPVDVKCSINKQWIYNKTICTESYSNMEFRLYTPFGENHILIYNGIENPSVIASYTPVQNMRTYPEVQCSEEFKTLRPGQITCPKGEATVSRPPSCEKPCTTFPEEVSCEDTTEVQYLESRTCTCLNSSLPVTITCDADGLWRDLIFPCSNIL